LFEILIDTPFGGATALVGVGDVVELEPVLVDAVLPVAVLPLVEPEAVLVPRPLWPPAPLPFAVDPPPWMVVDPPLRAEDPPPWVVVVPPP
jgi:hypothetical protein